MNYRFIKNFKIPIIGQGVGSYDWKKEHKDVIEKGINLGSNLVDTAECYSDGKSEQLIGHIISKIGRENLIISTKFSPENNDPIKLKKALLRSLGNLNTDYIDFYQMHWLHPKVYLSDILSTLYNLKKDKYIKYLGLDNLTIAELKHANLLCSLDFIQIEYNLFDRTIEDKIIPYCIENDILIMAYSPLDQGRIIDGDKRKKELQYVADRYKKSISQIALKWITRFPNVIAIPRTVNEKHLLNNINIFDFDLSYRDIVKIGEITKRDIIKIPPKHITVIQNKHNPNFIYDTLQKAIKNDANFIPSPYDLSKIIDKDIKPIRIYINDGKFELIEGQIRFWAWVIRYGEEEPIPCLVREEKFKE